MISKMAPRKRKAFEKSTEVRRQARLRVGPPPAERTHEDRRKKSPKHKKRTRLEETETA